MIGGGEFELDLLAGELLVNGRKGVDLVFDVGSLLWIEVDLADLGAIEAIARVLAHDLSGVHKVLQDALVDGSERAAARQ